MIVHDPWRRAWRFFSSDLFLALILIGLGLLLAASALLPQTPQNDPVAYSRWLSETQQRFGGLTGLLMALGLFSAVASIPFKLALGGLGVSCALRWLDQIDRFRSRDRLVQHRTRLLAAALLVYGGTLIVLTGLIMGSFSDYRLDNVSVVPGTLTPVTGAPYALRLDAVTPDEHASIALLSQGDVTAQSDLAYRRPLVAGGLSIYLESVGPAIVLSAKTGDGKSLGLQSTSDSPPQPEMQIAFTADRSEGFVAAPEIGVVLRVTPTTRDKYRLQVYQSATGKVLADGELASQGSLMFDQATVSSRPAAFITVSIVSQPSHGLVIPGGLLAMLGLCGLIVGRVRRGELESKVEPLLSASSEVPIAATPRKDRAFSAQWLLWLVWSGWTIGLIAQAVAAYQRDASFGTSTAFNIYLAAWMAWSGSLITARRTRASVLVAGLLFGVIAVWQLA